MFNVRIKVNLSFKNVSNDEIDYILQYKFLLE